MNEHSCYRDDHDERRTRCCYFHPRVFVVGVCALCLNERLLVLASSRQHHSKTPTDEHPPLALFHLTNLLNRLHIKHHRKTHGLYCPSSSTATPEEDSFISIKFEDNGAASWDNDGKILSKMRFDHQKCSIGNTDSKTEDIKSSVIEHTRRTLRWQRRIGHLFHLIRWKKRSSKGNMCHSGTKLDRSKVKNGWIRTLIKRKIKE